MLLLVATLHYISDDFHLRLCGQAAGSDSPRQHVSECGQPAARLIGRIFSSRIAASRPPRNPGGRPRRISDEVLDTQEKGLKNMSESLNLPVVPMRNSVLFPGVGLPINAGRPFTLRAIEAAVNGSEKRVFAVAQRQDGDEVAPENLYTIGTIATLGSVQRGLGGMRLLLQGESRGIALRYASKNGYLEATVQEAREIASSIQRTPMPFTGPLYKTFSSPPSTG